MLIDIGGGTAPAEGCTNLDPAHGEGIWRRRIQDGIPTADGTVQAVRASHVLEHIPAGRERIAVFNEVWRVLVGGGTFEIIVPLIQYCGKPIHTWHAWADPDHKSQWVLPESVLYFTQDGFAPNADYGIHLFAPLREEDMEVRHGFEGRVVLWKPNP